MLKLLLTSVIKSTVAALLVLNCNQLTATITKVKDWSDLQPIFDNLSPNTLLVLDVDWTLIVPSDRILQPHVIPSADLLMRQVAEKTQRVWDAQAFGRLYQQRKAQLLDKCILSCLKKIHTSQSKAVALTALRTGSYGSIASLEDWRCNELQDLGINLRSLCPLKNRHVFHSLARHNQKPVLQQGILFSAFTPKGEVLASFLDYVENRKGWQPQEVIFIDDNASFIASVETSMRQRGIPFRCYHIQHPIQQLTKQEVAVAIEQMTYFLKSGNWLSDHQIKQRLF